MDIQKKLQRLKPHMNRSHPVETVPEEQDVPEQKWHAFQCDVLPFEDGYAVRRRRRYPLSHMHGIHPFKELQRTVAAWKEAGIEGHPLAPGKELEAEDLVFLDTETTGLSHGAGNMIFMIGTAQLSEEEIIVDQFFLPGPEHEIAFYHHFLMNKTSLHALVTYNGKAFDWPQLKTRHTLLREELPTLPAFGHFDLLHAARRLFKHELASCRLNIVEEEILGFVRDDDIPGYLAPMFYQDFLSEGEPSYIEGVFHHNEQDLLSLISLYIKLSGRVLNGGTTAKETYEIARWWRDTKHYARAMDTYAEVNDQNDWYEHALYERGHLLKKTNRHADSIDLFQKVWAMQGRLAPNAAEALAIWYEHHKKDYVRAYYYSKRGQAKTQNRDAKSDAWEHRLERLRRKLGNEAAFPG
ncbi:ribonuclease H-like domain-containing protein [Salicibibacter cibi]|uniref:Ribonuclease H-like domain-containing protein n=1 Tax=Salicibibacter cibi TaxID=2743001 RepID=A0A7T6ZAM2_9BACI|nr:ribonuclease H-like domain-containing protein [Salicibibacter cibi]QQK79993.1 ribonuclease H-like domain-containing protein [Salicibibacter cibi]